ncbi:hypothetical protein OAC86_01085 [bacterium]|nr:hypothetical protein [bacterium]
MKKVILYEDFIEEAKRGVIHKAAKKGSYPAVIVVVQDGKVIHQEPVSTPDIAPATFNVMQEKYPKALLHLEDKTGKRLFSESIVTEKREDVGKYNTVKKVIAKLGRRPSEQELATFINNNYYDVTEVERGEDDPTANDKIADLVGFYKFDIEDWETAWADAQNESLVNEAKKYKFKDLAKAWEFVYGEEMEDEYVGFYQEVTGKYKNKVTKEDIAKIWDELYGEDIAAEHEGFFSSIKESVVNEAEKYITDEFKVGDKIKTNFGEWEVIETDYAPNKSFIAPFIFKGKDMERVNIPNPPKTNKKAVGYKVTDGDKYPIIGFLYQYKDITKLATVGVDESVLTEDKDMTFVDYLEILDQKFVDAQNAVRGDNGTDAEIKPTRGDILQNFTLFRNYVSALTKKYKGDKTKLRFITEREWTFNETFKSVFEQLAVTEGKIKYSKGKTYQSDGHWTVYVDSNSSGFDIRVNHSAGWRLDPQDPREETIQLLDNGRQRATLMFKSGNIDKFAQNMFDLNDRTSNGNQTKLTAKDYADIIRVWIDMKMANESVTEAKNTIGLAFKEEQDYLDFKEFVAEQPRGAIRKNIGFDSKTKSWNVEMDVKVLDSIYGEGTSGNKESGWYGGLPDDFESVIIESVVTESEYQGMIAGDVAEDIAKELSYNVKQIVKQPNDSVTYFQVKDKSSVNKTIQSLIDLYGIEAQSGGKQFSPSITVKFDNDQMVSESVVTESVFTFKTDNIEQLHFETDPKTAEEMKIELGKKQGEVSKRKQIESGEYSLRRFRKEIKFGDGTYLGVFLPGSYDAATSTLGDGPHAKAVKKIKWTQKKYDQWLEDMAANGGAENAFDMAQNAKNEPGLLGWVEKEFRGDDALQRIQWDIEAFAESVVTEARFNYKETGLSGQNLKDVKDGITGIKNALKRGNESAVISNYDLVQQRLQQYGGPKASEFLEKIKQLAGLDESIVTESKFANKDEVTVKQLADLKRDIAKINKNIKVYISTHPVTKGELSIELGADHDDDNEIDQINSLLKKHTGDHKTGSMFGESLVTESEASSALLAFMDDEIKDGNDAQVHIATFSGNSMEAQSTKKTWDDGVPVTKNFTRGGYKTIAPKGKIWILESEKFWYFQDKGIWYAVKIADYGTPPFEY